MKRRKWLDALLVTLAVTFALTGCGPSTVVGDAGPVITIQNKGSDTMVNLALAWAEHYQEINPQARIAVTGGGSGTGITALLNGTVDIANASRQIKTEELNAARANNIEVQELVIALDAIAIVIHPSNPVNELTLQQISDIYSGKITNWKEVGGEDRPIVLLSRETNSGTHVYFLEEVIRLGQQDNKTLFSPDTLLLPSSEGIGAEVRQNPNAIGYDGLGYVTHDMKTVNIGLSPEGPFWPPTVETVNSGQYPIARELFLYIASTAPEAVNIYLTWLFSPEAQRIVFDLGFVPVAATE